MVVEGEGGVGFNGVEGREHVEGDERVEDGGCGE